MAGSSGDASAQQSAWARAVETVKQKVISPTLWRALERVGPVVWEDDTFVVGLAAVEGQMAGQLNAQENRLAIENALRQATGVSTLTLRVIEGNDVSDWEAVKRRDAAGTLQRAQASQKQQAQNSAFSSWDDIYDQVTRLWAASEFRSLSTGRARYVEKTLAIVAEAVPALYPDFREKPTELGERGLSRVLERIAQQSSTDPVLVTTLLLARLGN